MSPPRTPGSTGSASTDLSWRRVPAPNGDITVVEFLDRRLIDAAHIADVGQQIKALVAQMPVPRLVLSFEKVEYLSSTALNVVIELERLIRQHKGQFRIANLAPEIEKIFTLMKLHKVIQLCQDTEQAIKSIRS